MTERHSPVEPLACRPSRQDGIEKYLSRALGQELRRRREEKGWSRGQLVALLPSGIGERTLLAYEHGTRHLTVLRLLELCQALGVPAPALFSYALQRAEVYLANLVLRIDLRQLAQHRNESFGAMGQWAYNKLDKCPDGIAELLPVAVVELADLIGHTPQDLATHLARFLPDSIEDTGEAR